MKKFTCDMMIHLSDTDMTGVIFFPKLFEKSLLVLENFLKSKNLLGLFVKDHHVFPVVSTHGQYFLPVTDYDTLKCELQVTKIGETSAIFSYKFTNHEGFLALEAQIIHVCVDKKTRLKKALPEAWIEILKTIYPE